MTQPRRSSDIVALLVRSGPYVSGPEVLAELRRVIASGLARPGSPIPLDGVAEFFGVSRIPVREALKTLVGEGLLEHEARLGYTVADLSPDELMEVYLVRQALEAAALGAAIRLATAADHARVRAVHESLDDERSATDPVAYQQASRAFHDALLRPCRMPRLLHMLDIAWNLTMPAQAMQRITEDERRLLRADHDAMLEAFVARDAPRMTELADRHHERLSDCLAGIDPV